MKVIAAALLTAAAFTATAAYCDMSESSSGSDFAPKGFDINTPKCVNDIFESGYDDQMIKIRGRLTNFLGEDRYEFTDLSGVSIEVELDDDYNWSHISKDQLIDLTGKIDKDFFKTKIEAKSASCVKTKSEK